VLPPRAARFIIEAKGTTPHSRRWAVFYFAYASNMNQAQMKRWCPASRFFKTALLDGFRFVYDGFSVTWDGAVGNIVKSESECVWGALYEITERDRLTLDAFEGYPRSYDHKEVEVRDRDGGIYKAVTYFRTGRALGKPHPDYERIVIDGAKECGLPEDYVDRALRVIRL
jgi:gamma-glutamylcyclotransferase